MSGLDGLGWPDEAEAGPLVVRSIAEYGSPKEPGIYWTMAIETN